MEAVGHATLPKLGGEPLESVVGALQVCPPSVVQIAPVAPVPAGDEPTARQTVAEPQESRSQSYPRFPIEYVVQVEPSVVTTSP